MQLDESRFEIEDLKDEMTKAQESLQRKVENVSNVKKNPQEMCVLSLRVCDGVCDVSGWCYGYLSLSLCGVILRAQHACGQ